MSWHLALMIIGSVLYIMYKIWIYSLSITTTYYHAPKNRIVVFKRWLRRVKRSIAGYFKWYTYKDFVPIVIAWLIYGGIFLW